MPKETEKCDISVKMNEGHICAVLVLLKSNARRQFEPVLSSGQQGSAAGMLRKPWGVAANEHNEIAVSDNGNNRIRVFK